MYRVTDAQAEKLVQYEAAIKHSGELISSLGEVVIVGVTGPSAIGTTSIIRESGLYKVPGFTTRPERHKNEAGIRFLPHTKAVVDECIAKAEAGELAQIKLSPEGHIYGSESDDYIIGQPNVVDMHAASILKLLTLPIKQLIPVYVVSPVLDWIERFERERGSFAENTERLWNDVESLRVTAETNDVDFIPLINHKDGISVAAMRLGLIARDGFENEGDSEEAELMRRDLLREMSLLTV